MKVKRTSDDPDSCQQNRANILLHPCQWWVLSSNSIKFTCYFLTPSISSSNTSVHLPPPPPFLCFFQAVVEVCDVTSTKPSELPEERASIYQNIGGVANKNKDRLCNILPSKTILCTVPSSLVFIFSLFLRLILIIESVYVCLSPRFLGTSRLIHRLFFIFFSFFSSSSLFSHYPLPFPPQQTLFTDQY